MEHDPLFDPTPGDWQTDTGGEPTLIYAPPAQGGDSSILIATVQADGTEQSATNARVLAASPSMLRLLRAFQRDMEAMGFGTDESISGADAVDLLNSMYDAIGSVLDQYDLQPKRESQPHELTLRQFAGQAKVIALLNHGRKWEVRLGNYRAFSDASTPWDAIKDVHHAAVNNALFLNTPWAREARLSESSMPPIEVLADYPELAKLHGHQI